MAMSQFWRWLLALSVLIAFGVQGGAITPAGVQCPQAPRALVLVQAPPPKTCCHCPAKPAKAQFVQCRCTERRTAEAKSIGSAKFVFILPEPARIGGVAMGILARFGSRPGHVSAISRPIEPPPPNSLQAV